MASLLDRYDVAIALQTWASFFTRALTLGVVSLKDEVWIQHRESALEYLARARFMDVSARFCDGIAVSGVAQLGAEGMAAIRTDTIDLLMEIDRVQLEKTRDMVTQFQERSLEDRVTELRRVVEMRDEHRQWFGEDALRIAFPAQVAADTFLGSVRESMKEEIQSGALAFNAAFFRPPKVQETAAPMESGAAFQAGSFRASSTDPSILERRVTTLEARVQALTERVAKLSP